MSFLCDSLQLPVLMPSRVELINKLGNEETSLGELAKLIQLDAVIATRLLKVANSPFFGMKGKIASVDEAILVIGTSSTRAYVLADLLMGHFRQPPWNVVDLRSFWENSLLSACCTQVLASRTLVPASWAFSLGLFQGIGELAMLGTYGLSYLSLFQNEIKGQSLVAREREIFSTDHAEAGAEMLAVWNLPDSVVQSVASQYSAPAAVNPDIQMELLKCSNRISLAMRDERPLTMDELPWSYADLFKLNDPVLANIARVARSQLKGLTSIIEGGSSDE